MFASIIGAWQALLKQTDETGDNAFKDKITRLLTYMEYREFKPSLRNAVVLHYAHLWHSERCLDHDGAVVNELPAPLRMEIAHCVIGQALGKVPVIRDCELLTRKRLADVMRKQVAGADSTIFEVGDIGWEVYFIASGTVKIELPSSPDVGSSKNNQEGKKGGGEPLPSPLFPPPPAPRRSRAGSTTGFLNALNGSRRSGRANNDINTNDNDNESGASWTNRRFSFAPGGLDFSPQFMSRRRASVLGQIYQEGNHFGEGCMLSATGARVEDALALTVVELFTISQENLDDVLAFMPGARREKFLSDLLTRNGTITHTEVPKIKKRGSTEAANTANGGTATKENARVVTLTDSIMKLKRLKRNRKDRDAKASAENEVNLNSALPLEQLSPSYRRKSDQMLPQSLQQLSPSNRRKSEHKTRQEAKIAVSLLVRSKLIQRATLAKARFRHPSGRRDSEMSFEDVIEEAMEDEAVGVCNSRSDA